MRSTPSMSRSIAESRNSPNKRGWAESTKEPRPPGSPAPHHRNRDRHKDLPRQKRSEVVFAKAATLRSPCTTDETEGSDFGRRRSTTKAQRRGFELMAIAAWRPNRFPLQSIGTA